MKIAIGVIVFAVLTVVCQGTVRQVPQDYRTIREAISAADSGDTIKISPGTYKENLIIEKTLNLVGEQRKSCIVQGARRDRPVITVAGDVGISKLTIRDGRTGVFAKAAASLKIEDCNVTKCALAGVAFEPSFNSTFFMKACWVTENGDGIDLRSTQAKILTSTFLKNTDDGVGCRGDVGLFIYGCRFDSNGDDGIEIRLARRSHLIVVNSGFQRNKEDGIEVINSTSKDDIYNLLCVQKCSFKSNLRYGLGFVSAQTQRYTGEMLNVSVYATSNEFWYSGIADVTDNYDDVIKASWYCPNLVGAKIGRKGQKEKVVNLIVQDPLLVGIYNLRPTTNGTFAGDGEGVTVLGNRVYVADDSGTIFVLDRKTGAVVKKIRTRPFAGSNHKALGPEGVDIVNYQGRDALIISDDDGRALFTVSIDEDSYGQLLRRQDTGQLSFEGVEQLGDKLIMTNPPNRLYMADMADAAKIEAPVAVEFDSDFGRHIAGVGVDQKGKLVYATVSGYSRKPQRDYKGGFFEMNSQLTGIRQFWDLGPFSNDPRGICVSDGLVYVVDGRSDFKISKTGEMYRGGIKVFVFMPQDRPMDLKRIIPFLPLRKDPTVK